MKYVAVVVWKAQRRKLSYAVENKEKVRVFRDFKVETHIKIFRRFLWKGTKLQKNVKNNKIRTILHCCYTIAIEGICFNKSRHAQHLNYKKAAFCMLCVIINKFLVIAQVSCAKFDPKWAFISHLR